MISLNFLALHELRTRTLLLLDQAESPDPAERAAIPA